MTIPQSAPLVLFMTVGVPGCGKSTWCAERPLSKVCPDDIRQELTGDPSDQSKNGEVFRVAHDRTRAALDNGQSVIFDSTGLTKSARDDLFRIAQEAEAIPCAVLWPNAPAVALERNLGRSRVVPAEIMDKMIQRRSQISVRSLEAEGWNVISPDPLVGEKFPENY